MGVDTKAKLTSNPTYEEVMLGLEKIGATEVRQVVYEEPRMTYYMDDNNEEQSYMNYGYSRINFNYKFKNEEYHRSIYMIYNTEDDNRNTIPKIDGKYSYLFLDANDVAIEIMDKLAEEFSGYIIPYDSASPSDNDFCYFKEGKNELALDDKTRKLFSALGDNIGEKIAEKIKFIDNIIKNKDAIEKYIRSSKIE